MQRDVVAIRGLMVDCVVGVYPHERDAPQPLKIDVELRLDTEDAAVHEKLSRTVDYDFMAAQITFLLESSQFRLLETAAHVLARYLLAPPAPGERRPQVSSLRLALEKPEALGGRAVPFLQIERKAKWVQLDHERTQFGIVDIIHETKDAGVYRLNIAPGKEIPLHMHERMRESEMVLGRGLLCQGKPAPRGSVHRWPLGAAHVYENPTSNYQTVLCVDSPPFIAEDEIPVSGEPADVTQEPYWSGGSP